MRLRCRYSSTTSSKNDRVVSRWSVRIAKPGFAKGFGVEVVHLDHLVHQLAAHGLPRFFAVRVAQIVTAGDFVHDDRGDIGQIALEVGHLDATVLQQPVNVELALQVIGQMVV